MVTLMVMEFENSAATYREMTMAQAYHLASNGNFYKAQIVNEFGMSGGEELPITFGHQSSNEELKTVIRKYRRRGNTGLISITGAVE